MRYVPTLLILASLSTAALAEAPQPQRGQATAPTVVADKNRLATPAGEAPRQLPGAQAGVARLVGEQWLSSTKNDYNLSIDAAGRTLVFARSEADFEHARILWSRREGDAWSSPQPVPFTDARYRDSDPWLTPDGRTLYFISNRPQQGEAPRKDLDLWRVPVREDGFGTPEPLAALSSEGEELGPELHDGWLYFNSTRTGGPAGLAIYRARQRSDGGFDAPEPLGTPFNDGRAQGDFTLSPDGQVALFWSIREESKDADLFAARREGEGWSKAVRLPAPINAPGFDFTPAFTADGSALYFASTRKPAEPDDAATVLNGEANLYIVPIAQMEAAL